MGRLAGHKTVLGFRTVRLICAGRTKLSASQVLQPVLETNAWLITEYDCFPGIHLVAGLDPQSHAGQPGHHQINLGADANHAKISPLLGARRPSASRLEEDVCVSDEWRGGALETKWWAARIFEVSELYPGKPNGG